MFGDGIPVTAVGDPDQNIYAWRGASLFNLLRFPEQFPRPDGTPAARLPLYTNFRSGARILAAADDVIRPLPEQQRPDPDKQLRPVDPAERRGRGRARPAARTSGRRPSGSPTGSSRCTRTAPTWSELRGALPTRAGCSSAAAGVRRARGAGRDRRAGRAPEAARGRRGPRVRARGADPPRAWRSRGSCSGPRTASGSRTWRASRRWRRREAKLFARTRGGRRRGGRRSCSPRRSSTSMRSSGSPTRTARRLEEFRDELASLRDEARKPVGEFLGEVVRRTGLLAELDADPIGRRHRGQAEPRRVHGPGPRVRAGRGRARRSARSWTTWTRSSASTSRSGRRCSRRDEDSVKVMTIHAAKGLEFDNVFVPGMAKGLLPNPRSSTTRPSAGSRWTSSSAATPRSCRASTAS